MTLFYISILLWIAPLVHSGSHMRYSATSHKSRYYNNPTYNDNSYASPEQQWFFPNPVLYQILSGIYSGQYVAHTHPRPQVEVSAYYDYGYDYNQNMQGFKPSKNNHCSCKEYIWFDLFDSIVCVCPNDATKTEGQPTTIVKCIEENHVCVPKHLCKNGQINYVTEEIMRAATEEQHCNVNTHVCCCLPHYYYAPNKPNTNRPVVTPEIQNQPVNTESNKMPVDTTTIRAVVSTINLPIEATTETPITSAPAPAQVFTSKVNSELPYTTAANMNIESTSKTPEPEPITSKFVSATNDVVSRAPNAEPITSKIASSTNAEVTSIAPVDSITTNIVSTTNEVASRAPDVDPITSKITSSTNSEVTSVAPENSITSNIVSTTDEANTTLASESEPITSKISSTTNMEVTSQAPAEPITNKFAMPLFLSPVSKPQAPTIFESPLVYTSKPVNAKTMKPTENKNKDITTGTPVELFTSKVDVQDINVKLNISPEMITNRIEKQTQASDLEWTTAKAIQSVNEISQLERNDQLVTNATNISENDTKIASIPNDKKNVNLINVLSTNPLLQNLNKEATVKRNKVISGLWK